MGENRIKKKEKKYNKKSSPKEIYNKKYIRKKMEIIENKKNKIK